MSSFLPYIQLYSYKDRLSWARQIQDLPHRRPVVMTCSLWHPTKFECLILHENHTLYQLFQYITHQFHLPTKNGGFFNTANDVLDMADKIQDLASMDDETVYISLKYF